MKTGIYIIRNTVNGKVYVGSAVRVANRWAVHRKALNDGRHHSGHLQYAWELYGADVFEFVLIEPVAVIADLISREQHWIDYFHAADDEFGYNILPNAGSSLGVKTSAATKLKLSEALRGRSQTPEHIEKRIAVHRGKKRPTETRAKLKAARNKRPPASAATLQKNKESSTRAWQAEELREEQRKRRTAFCQSAKGQSDRAKQSESMRSFWANPENRAAQAEARRLRWLDPEYRAKVLAGQEEARRRKAEAANRGSELS